MPTPKKPASRFTRLDEGAAAVSPRAKGHAMVQDTTTGLIWSAQSLKVSNWADAQTQCKACRIGGHEDWRMPTVTELFGIVDHTKREPAIDSKAFPNTPSAWHWSSSPVVGWPEDACSVGFSYGYVYYLPRSFDGFVRPVRVASPRQ